MIVSRDLPTTSASLATSRAGIRIDRRELADAHSEHSSLLPRIASGSRKNLSLEWKPERVRSAGRLRRSCV